ncbi:MAG: HAMP domain-containing histidine kinase [Bacteroidetes bacterium]|nr:HAMP domain-containing histidine kinase [Bacteroidota bacterium]
MGIILIQVSWIKNMVLLREEQIKHRVGEAAMLVAEQLVDLPNSYTPGTTLKKRGLIEGMGWDFFVAPTVASRHTSADIQKRFEKAFRQFELKGVSFEFGIATLGPLGNNLFEKTSPRFFQVFEDTIHNYFTIRGLRQPASTGLMGEAIGVNELLFVAVPGIKDIVLRSLRWNIAASILFTLAILAVFYFTIRTMIRQKKIGEMKTDFINNMTHEFKTPLATISLAVDAMQNEKVIQNQHKMRYFSDIIKEENLRMNKQVETILKASQLDKGEVQLNLKPIAVHSIIQNVVDNFKLQLDHTGGHINLFFKAPNDKIVADEVHLFNLLTNLIDNAIKYAKEQVPPLIQIETNDKGRYIQLRIEDNGIGMNRDTLKRIFEKFYRAHTGNRHNVKGFGLGLSYVKSVTEAMGGKIHADSTVGSGSTFILELPLQLTK